MRMGFFLALGVISQPTFADNPRFYTIDVKGWDVIKTPFACEARMTYEGSGSTKLLFHYTKDAGSTLIIVVNDGWSADKGREYRVSFEFDKVTWNTPAAGFIDYDGRGFGAEIDDDALNQFSSSTSVKLRFTETKNLIDRLRLDGSAAALAKFRACRMELRGDEFDEAMDRERLSGIPRDPFKQD